LVYSSRGEEMEELHEYLEKKNVREIFKEMMEELVNERPSNVHSFLVNYIQENYADKLEDVMVEYEDADVVIEDHPDDIISEKESKEQETKAVGRRRRSAVSAEPMDPESMKNRQKKVIEKSDEDKKRCLDRLSTCFLFAALDKESFHALVDAVDVQSFVAGETLMRQGDDGDFFYVVEEGNAEIFVKMEDGEEKMVKACGPGDSFGELALMYNAPRAATVMAISDLRCWAVDRETFKHTLMESTINKRDRYEKFLDDVPILETLYKYEKLTIADSLKAAEFKKGDVVMKEGEQGDMFYIIESGSVEFSKEDGGKMGNATTGGYFGEIALLTNDTRKATVTCTDDCSLLSLDRQTFVRTMGPLGSVLKRNMKLYMNYQ